MAKVIDVLRRFLPAYLESRPVLNQAQGRAIWAIEHCRTAMLGGNLHRCGKCAEQWAFAYHSCNHRACPQCGREETRQWVRRELRKRVGAPYFMVTFTLPAELRGLFFGAGAKAAYDLFFRAAAGALREKLADPKWLGATVSGLTVVLHTWNQLLLFHPHLHCIVPGAGIDAEGKVVRVKNANFLMRVEVLSGAFRQHFRLRLQEARWEVDPAVWRKDWGVNIQPFSDAAGNGAEANAIKYLGAYVCRTAIGDSRIVAMDESEVTFRWKDRDDHNREKQSTIPGVEFVRRYLRHVLPRGLRSIRRYGYCHPAAKNKRERVQLHTGMPLLIGPPPAESETKPHPWRCPCCGGVMKPVAKLPRLWTPSPVTRSLRRRLRAPPRVPADQDAA